MSGITALSESRENDKVINVRRIWIPIASDLDPNDTDMLSRGSLLIAVSRGYREFADPRKGDPERP